MIKQYLLKSKSYNQISMTDYQKVPKVPEIACSYLKNDDLH